MAGSGEDKYNSWGSRNQQEANSPVNSNSDKHDEANKAGTKDGSERTC